MLTRRQSEILIDYYTCQDRYLSGAEIADDHGVSLRTVQNDVARLRKGLEGSGARLESINSKGTRLVIDDEVAFSGYFATVRSEYMHNYGFGNQQARINHIMRTLLDAADYVKSGSLANEMYESRSQFNTDLGRVKAIFADYRIEIVSKPAHGIRVQGNERDIRECIIKENLDAGWDISSSKSPKAIIGEPEMTLIKNIVTEKLIASQLTVSDVVFQNLVVHIMTSIRRIRLGHCVENDIELGEAYQHIVEVASDIMRQCCRVFGIEYSQGEADLLALNIQGKREYSSEKYVSREINDFVFETLSVIKSSFGIDFMNDMSLRIALALHTLPLITRMRLNMQLTNLMTFEIKQRYIMAFNIATLYAEELSRHYGIRLSDDETSYIALHFGVAMNRNTQGSRKVLLVSPEKKSNTILLRQKFDQWFGTDIKSFDIVNPSVVTSEVLGRYDAVFSTDAVLAEKIGAVFVSFFPQDDDYRRIQLALNGFRSLNDLIGKFDGDLFFASDLDTKSEAIDLLCSAAERRFDLDGHFRSCVLEHEESASSYFGNRIAVLHPGAPATEDTFVGVCINSRSIPWCDEDERVRLILLVSIEKDNPKAFNLWYYLSFLISSNSAVESIVRKPTRENFIQTIADLYRMNLGSDENER